MSLVPSSDRNGLRASAPLGVVLLVGLAVALSTGVGAAALGIGVLGAGSLDTGTAGSGEFGLGSTESASLSASATVEGRIQLEHEGGDTLDVRTLDLRLLIDGEELARQPPVPFFSAEGFKSGPTGPFNPAADQTWRAGESASLEVAGTNEPAVRDGSRIEIELYAGGAPVAKVETTAQRE
ncbi:flagellin domain protein [Halalkaliarchaeum desulfuricum]|uniref:Flagellin domain protein n=1 Tax=Halalkaliarchaeum desulfuricum TaxID=2055893 RepID=A0A343TH22_9EURY|nr:type IV pilin [Halalkaliarchaeum desulfuricum]AUX08394.1 flagellin domain protein [Halalkaliarchaeum desulfuricum]